MVERLTSARLARTVSGCGRIGFREPPNDTHHASPYFSRASLVNGVVRVSGTGAGTHADGTPRRGTAAQEARWAMENVDKILRECGSNLESVYQVTMLVGEKGFYAECNREYLTFFDPARLPMRTCAVWGVPTDMKVGFACEALLAADGGPATSKL